MKRYFMHRKSDDKISKNQWIPEELFNKIQNVIPIVCIDLVVVKESESLVMLFKRKIPPEVGKWVNIGGRIFKGERLDEAIQRQANYEFGTTVSVLSPYSPEMPIAVFSEPFCDTQKHPIALVYPVVLEGAIQDSGPEYSEWRWFPIDKLPTDVGFEPLHRQEILCVADLLQKKGIARHAN